MTNAKRDIFDILAVISMIASNVFMLCLFVVFAIPLIPPNSGTVADWVNAISTAISVLVIGAASLFFLHRQSRNMEEQNHISEKQNLISAEQNRISSITYYHECYTKLDSAKKLAIQTSLEDRDLAEKLNKQLEAFIDAKHYAELFMSKDIVDLCNRLHTHSSVLYASGKNINGTNDEKKKTEEKEKFYRAHDNIIEENILECFVVSQRQNHDHLPHRRPR